MIFLHEQVYDNPKSWTSAFTRSVYQRADRPTEVIVVYEGDASKAGQFPHGNDKAGSRNYVRTQPHVLRNIAASTTTQSVNSVYQTLVALSGPVQPSSSTSAPRNYEQVRNTMKQQRNSQRLTHDAIFNLTEFAHDTDFVKRILLFPDLEVVMVNEAAVVNFRSLLTEQNDDRPPQQLSYDTTFCLGDFYLSVLLYRETEFDPSPVVPLAFYIHERKLQSTHDAFMSYMASILPELKSATNVYIVTDGETAITTSIKNNFPGLRSFLCWNHIVQDCKRWLRNHGVSNSQEMLFYTDSLRTLLLSSDLAAYGQELLQRTTTWSQPFTKYFLDTFHPVIDKIGSWEQRRYGGELLTSNQSESFNSTLKKLQQWKEAPVDAMVLVLYRLAQAYENEIARGRAGLGNYKLRPGAVPVILCPTSTNFTFHDIVERIRSAPRLPLSSSSTPSPTLSSPQQSASPPSQQLQPSASQPSTSEQPQQSNDDDTRWCSAYERASAVISSGKLTLDSKLGVFTVMGSSEPRVVRLHPKPTCSCPARAACYHIIAAQMAVGSAEKPHSKAINITRLRKNFRKRQDRTSGRKKPRLQDVDVVPADDMDDDTSAAVTAAVLSTVPETEETTEETTEEANKETAVEQIDSSTQDMPNNSADDASENCVECGCRDPPLSKSKRNKKTVEWIQCDKCDYWYHIDCLQTKIDRRRKFACNRCV